MRYSFSFALYALFILTCSCKTIQEQETGSQGALSSGSPMSCKIEGQVICILRPFDADTASACAKYPCMAVVLIRSVSGCGSSISFSLSAGDTVQIKFTTTLLNTVKVFPSMKAHYPGLKKGDKFIANAEQRIKPGGGEYIINAYTVE